MGLDSKTGLIVRLDKDVACPTDSKPPIYICRSSSNSLAYVETELVTIVIVLRQATRVASQIYLKKEFGNWKMPDVNVSRIPPLVP